MTNWLTHGIAALTGLVPALVMYLIGTQKKVLGYAVVKNEPMIKVRHPELNARLAVTLDGKVVSGGRFMELVIQNLGMKDIESQTVHLMFPPAVGILHAHCSSSTLAVAPKIEGLEDDSYRINVPLMNPGDKVTVNLFMINNEGGRILVAAKGPNLKFRSFDPATFISPVVNRSLLVVSAIIFGWIFWACTGTDRFMAKPFWEKTISSILIALFLALPASILAYQGIIPLLKKALQWKVKTRLERTESHAE